MNSKNFHFTASEKYRRYYSNKNETFISCFKFTNNAKNATLKNENVLNPLFNKQNEIEKSYQIKKRKFKRNNPIKNYYMSNSFDSKYFKIKFKASNFTGNEKNEEANENISNEISKFNNLKGQNHFLLNGSKDQNYNEYFQLKSDGNCDPEPKRFTISLFKQLQIFLGVVFTYQPVHLEDLQNLSKEERLILKFLIKSRHYRPAKKLGKTIDLKSRNYQLWFQFFKERRKEENLKTGFKFLVEHMRKEFIEQKNVNSQNLTPNDVQIYFYVYYFLEREQFYSDRDSFVTFFLSIKGNNKSYKNLIEKIQSFIFPEHVSKCFFANVKTISRNFLIKLAESQKFIRELLVLNLKMVLFSGFCLEHDWEKYEPEIFESGLTKTGISILKQISKENLKDLENIFFVWNKKSNCKLMNFENTKEKNDFFKIVQKSIKRKNFKFPWTFKELQNSFIECLLALVEVFKIHQFKISSEGGKFNFLTKDSLFKIYNLPFQTIHKKRIFLLDLFKNDFKPNGTYHKYFKGILNFHFLFSSIEEYFPRFENFRTQLLGNKIRFFQEPKWINFVSLSIFNEKSKEILELFEHWKKNQKIEQFKNCKRVF